MDAIRPCNCLGVEIPARKSDQVDSCHSGSRRERRGNLHVCIGISYGDHILRQRVMCVNLSGQENQETASACSRKHAEDLAGIANAMEDTTLRALRETTFFARPIWMQ